MQSQALGNAKDQSRHHEANQRQRDGSSSPTRILIDFVVGGVAVTTEAPRQRSWCFRALLSPKQQPVEGRFCVLRRDSPAGACTPGWLTCLTCLTCLVYDGGAPPPAADAQKFAPS